jgi:hypothetical protein
MNCSLKAAVCRPLRRQNRAAGLRLLVDVNQPLDERTHFVSDRLRLAAHGALGAMAMTGMRRVTTDLGLVQKPPPERIASEGIPGLFRRVAPEHRETAIELFHWGIGAVGGMGFGILPAALRRRRWAGPAYGLAILGFFESAILPKLGVAAKDQTFSERLALAGDHVLYGIILGAENEGGFSGSSQQHP